jgi:multiple sugar transport system permease protein
MPAVILFSLWHEAARVDGPGPWQEFWHITWPQLRPVTSFVLVITTILSLQSFTQFYQLSGGGPE